MPTKPAARAIAEVAARWPQVTTQVSACRKIAGTSSWSQHAYDNAVDFFGPGDQLEDVYQYLRSRKLTMAVNTLCYRGRGNCTTAHADHVHADFHPKQTGTPACAGGSSSPVLVPIPGGPVISVPGGVVDAVTGGVGAAIDQAASPLVAAGNALSFLTDADNWQRLGLGAAGVVTVALGVLLIVKDLSPAGELVDVAGSLLASKG